MQWTLLITFTWQIMDGSVITEVGSWFSSDKIYFCNQWGKVMLQKKKKSTGCQWWLCLLTEILNFQSVQHGYKRLCAVIKSQPTQLCGECGVYLNTSYSSPESVMCVLQMAFLMFSINVRVCAYIYTYIYNICICHKILLKNNKFARNAAPKMTNLCCDGNASKFWLRALLFSVN